MAYINSIVRILEISLIKFENCQFPGIKFYAQVSSTQAKSNLPLIIECKILENWVMYNQFISDYQINNYVLIQGYFLKDQKRSRYGVLSINIYNICKLNVH